MIPTSIPTGPAWAVAMGLVFGGLALLLKAGVPLIQAVRRNGKNGHTAYTRLEDIITLKAHIDDSAKGATTLIGDVAKESREHREKIMKNIDDTRHTLATPMSTIALSVALMEQTLIEIRDRLPRV